MRRVLTICISVVAIWAMMLLVTPTASASLCFICKSGSSNGCKQCKSSSGSDTSADRKKCRKIGCKIGGTTSCSSAANVKVCKASSVSLPYAPRSAGALSADALERALAAVALR